MSVPSVDGRLKADDAGPPPWHRRAGGDAFGFWTTAGLAGAALVFGFAVSAAAGYALIWLSPTAWFVPVGIAYLGEFLNAVFLGSIIGALAWVVRRSGRSMRDYFALTRLSRRDIVRVVACTAIMWAVAYLEKSVFGLGHEDAATIADQYRVASRAGALLPLWFAVVVVAPVTEESFFRGFLYRGWSQSRLDVLGTILLTAVIFGLIHVQYGWSGRCEVGFFAVLAGWLRWRSGSLFPPILFHAAIGASAMLNAAGV